MQFPRAISPGQLVVRPHIAVRRPNEGGFLALAAYVCYMAIGAFLTFGLRFVDPDALSRVANAYYAVFSRDPHLAAIGFVWSPLPSLMIIPFMPLKFIAPAIIESGFIATMLSAVFMAAAVYVLWSIFVDIGVRRWMRILFTVTFALHPMIVEFGGNGMTEALFVLLLLLQVKFLARWIRTDDLVPLVLAGVALGISYMVRYEAAPVGVGTGLLVGAVALLRARGKPRDRLLASVSDLIVYGLPLGIMFVLWAGISWMIVGDPFEQFGSVYGTSSQLAADYNNIFWQGVGGTTNVVYVTLAMLLLEPLFPIIVVSGIVVGLWRRDAGVLAVTAVFGSVLGFAVLAFLTGRTGGWWRYYITLIPMTVLLAGFVVSKASSTAWGVPAWSPPWSKKMRRLPPSPSATSSSSRRPGFIAIALTIALIAGAPMCIGGTLDAFRGLGFQLRDGRLEYRQAQVYRVEVGQEVASYLDNLKLKDGSVLVDVFLGFAVVINSDDPLQFVITPDRDFKAVLADPAGFNVDYILVPKPGEELAVLDAVNVAYPTMYDDGAGIGTLVKSFTSERGYNWRLYRVDH